MQKQIIPIHLGLNKSTEEVGLVGHAAALYDCYVHQVGESVVVNRRPGLKEFCDTGENASIDAIIWWEAQQKAVLVCNGKCFTIDDSSGTLTELTGTYFSVGQRAVLADFGSAVYGADRANINKITTTTVSQMADADAPTAVSHVAFMDQYLLANEIDSKKCHRSDVGAPDDWSSNWFSAEAKNDNLIALGVENLEVYLLGNKSLEVWEDTGADSPFARVEGGYIASGSIAPYSFIFCGPPVNNWVWVDQNKNLVVLNGRVTAPLSDALNKYLQREDVTVSDAAGDFISAVGHAFYVLHLPTQSETPVFDFSSGLWQQWGYWNSVAGEHQRWRGNCHALAPAWGKILIGDRANGKVYTLDEETYQDNGDTMKFLVRTGHIDRGDFSAEKYCSRIIFRAKKTAPGGGTTITMTFRYRNNGETSWSNERSVTLSAASGATDYLGFARQLGRYHTRQWEFSCTDNAPVAMLPPIEEFDIVY